MTEEKLRQGISKMMGFILPKEVESIEYELSPTGDKDEFYMSVVYIVDGDSEFLRRNNMRMSDVFRQEMNQELKRNINAYLNTNVIINSSGVRDKDYHLKLMNVDKRQNEAIEKIRKGLLK
jgi:predicted metallo-beta-lactamase superfamily hydrolase